MAPQSPRMIYIIMDNIRLYRRLTQAGFLLLILFMPAFDILRYDAASSTLYIFGNVWGLGLRQGFYADQTMGGAGYVAFNFLTHAILPWVIVLAVFPLMGLMFGRFFCGWMCPEGMLFEIADFITLKLTGRRNPWRAEFNDPPDAAPDRKLYWAIAAILLMIAVPPIVGVFLTGYFIAPSRIWSEIMNLSPSFGLKAGVIGVSAYMIITSVFVRHLLCKYVCAAGLMQMLLGWVSPVSLRVKLNRDEFHRCTDCRQCERACFMSVRPRANLKDINCVNCGLCISACNRELNGRGLFQYNFGPEQTGAVAADNSIERPVTHT